MRHPPFLGAVVLVLLATIPATAQVGRDVRFVTAERAEVRSGPSDSSEFYVTNRLTRDQPVEVVGELPGGWLAIKPPEGSFSYINTRFLRHLVADMPTHVVTLDNVKVPVFIGSEVMNRRPTVIGSTLEPGAQVVSRGRPIADDDGSWMPIEAPSKERRYLKASAVAKTPGDPGQVVRASAAVVPSPEHSSFTPTPGTLTSSAAPSANLPESPEQRWRKAELAERAGQVSEAIRLYALVGSDTAQTQPAISARALERARYLQGGYRNYGAGGVSQEPVYVGAPVSPGAPRAVPPPPAPPRETNSFTGQTPRLSPTRNGHTQWVTFRGVLRLAGRTIEGQKTYALDDPVTLRPILYASPARDVNFEPHLNRIVTLSGYSVYRGDLRINYMTAVRLEADR